MESPMHIDRRGFLELLGIGASAVSPVAHLLKQLAGEESQVDPPVPEAPAISDPNPNPDYWALNRFHCSMYPQFETLRATDQYGMECEIPSRATWYLHTCQNYGTLVIVGEIPVADNWPDDRFEEAVSVQLSLMYHPEQVLYRVNLNPLHAHTWCPPRFCRGPYDVYVNGLRVPQRVLMLDPDSEPVSL